MSMVNVSLVGNLVREPEQVCFASGRIKTTIVVAVNGPHRNSNNEQTSENSTDFYRVETWGKLAELAQKYLSKGNQVGISGRLIMEHWTDKEGRERLTPVVAATQLSLPPRSSATPRNGGYENFKERSNDDFPEAIAEESLAIVGGTTVKEPPAHYQTRKKRRHP